MNYELTDEVINYIEASVDETKELLKQLCLIPAPSHHEEKRAAFIKDWLENAGAEKVYIDDALNVVCPMNCDGRDDITVFMAHTDTVFSDMTEPMPYSEDDENIYSPGSGDNTVCLAIMLMAAKYIIKNNLKPDCGILFVANSCEEGLGNLKGVKQIMNDFSGRVKELYTFDGQYTRVENRCVGSHRYKITVKTEGGHSYGNFGNNNAIHVMSNLICSLYSCKVPDKEGAKTTYNVGGISGGTSVNTIAQECEMLYEYRSDSVECLEVMKNFFENEIDKARSEGNAEIEVEVLGIRPCGKDVDEEKLMAMTKRCVEVLEKYSGIPCQVGAGSTDCNIPQSLGVPAVCPGIYLGGGAHTKEEWVQKSSIPVGMRIAFEIILDYFEAL